MQTRSSPSRRTLRCLAAEAGITVGTSLSKPDLFRRLQESGDLNRLERRVDRRKRRRSSDETCNRQTSTSTSRRSRSRTRRRKRSSRSTRREARPSRSRHRNDSNNPLDDQHSSSKPRSRGKRRRRKRRKTAAPPDRRAATTAAVSSDVLAGTVAAADVGNASSRSNSSHTAQQSLPAEDSEVKQEAAGGGDEVQQVTPTSSTQQLEAPSNHAPAQVGPSTSNSSRSVKAQKPKKAKAARQKQKLGTPRAPALNARDPILLDALGEHQFLFRRPNGTQIAYNVESLVAYLLATGQFCEPETRLPFQLHHLQRLDQQAAQAKLQLGSVVQAFGCPSRYAAMRERRDGLEALERCAGQLVADMVGVIEDPADVQGDGAMRLLSDLFPRFAHLWQQMVTSSPPFAKQCMSQYLTFVMGPPNHPTADVNGLLRTTLTFLRDTANGSATTSSFGFGSSSASSSASSGSGHGSSASSSSSSSSSSGGSGGSAPNL